MSGTVGGSGAAVRGGVLGGLGLGAVAGNLLSTMSGLNGIRRKAERVIVRLNICLRTEFSAARNSSLLKKSEQPVRVAASTASAWKCS